MLTIICGEDSSASREYILLLKKDLEKKGFEIKDVPAKELVQNAKQNEQEMSLFSTKIAFFTTNINSLLSRSAKQLEEQVLQIALDKETTIIDWEENKSSRELKIAKLGKVKEFKPDKSIFQLLDLCFPGNKKQFILFIELLANREDGIFIFTMLSRHIRSLILASLGEFSSKTQPWQRKKISDNASKWKLKKLISFYEGLIKLDQSIKTSSNPYGVVKSIDILACYFL